MILLFRLLYLSHLSKALVEQSCVGFDDGCVMLFFVHDQPCLLVYHKIMMNKTYSIVQYETKRRDVT